MSTPYSISLLNDLHNYFPDLLYRSQRFQSVPDVLQYVISVANQNPYERERTAYVAGLSPATLVPSAAPSTAPSAVPSTAPSAVPSAALSAAPSAALSAALSAAPSAALSAASNTSNAIYQLLYGNRLPESEIVFSSSRPSRFSWVAEESSPDTILNNLFGQIFEVPSLQNFLDQSVAVHPTADQIHHHTTLTNATRNMDDNCAICQDPIEQGQNMRILNYCSHSFHVECIDTWFTTHVTCPTCRHDIRNNS